LFFEGNQSSERTAMSNGLCRFTASQSAIAFTAKPETVCPIQLFLKVAAPWGRGDLSAAASGYSISGFAIDPAKSRRNSPVSMA
jgi:hypothetical protein